MAAAFAGAAMRHLIVDQIGKDISGTGMDTNVTGRCRNGSSVFRSPRLRSLLPVV